MKSNLQNFPDRLLVQANKHIAILEGQSKYIFFPSSSEVRMKQR